MSFTFFFRHDRATCAWRIELLCTAAQLLYLYGNFNAIVVYFSHSVVFRALELLKTRLLLASRERQALYDVIYSGREYNFVGMEP